MYVIFGYVDAFDDQPLFWSNKNGWGSLDSATQFNARERKLYKNLPITSPDSKGSVWVKLPKRGKA